LADPEMRGKPMIEADRRGLLEGAQDQPIAIGECFGGIGSHDKPVPDEHERPAQAVDTTGIELENRQAVWVSGQFSLGVGCDLVDVVTGNAAIDHTHRLARAEACLHDHRPRLLCFDSPSKCEGIADNENRRGWPFRFRARGGPEAFGVDEYWNAKVLIGMYSREARPIAIAKRIIGQPQTSNVAGRAPREPCRGHRKSHRYLSNRQADGGRNRSQHDVMECFHRHRRRLSGG